MATRGRFAIFAAVLALAGAAAAVIFKSVPDLSLGHGFLLSSVIVIIAFTSIAAAVLQHWADRREGEGRKFDLDLSQSGAGHGRPGMIGDPITGLKGAESELEKAVERLNRINAIGWKLTSVIDVPELMKTIVQQSAELLNAEKVTIYLKNGERPAQALTFYKGRGFDENASFEGTGEYKNLFIAGKPMILPSIRSVLPGGTAQAYGAGAPLKMKGRVIGAIYLENGPGGDPFAAADLELLTTLSNYAVVAIENALLYEKMKKNYFATIQSLVNALEASDRFTKGHSERVRMLSVELGRHVGLGGRELELLEHAAILHDIGKIGIDNLILQKQGGLTPNEYSLIKTHPLIGDEILGPIETLEEVRKTIIQHHERYDGGGYPYGLKGDEISVDSKILSVVDTFDAMMTDRPYRKAHTLNDVKQELKLNAGTQFDPKIVDAFTKLLDQNGEDLLSAAGYNSLYSF